MLDSFRLGTDYSDGTDVVALIKEIRADRLHKGIGKAMLLMGIEEVRKAGYKGISVEENPAFYHKVGFEISTKLGINPSDKLAADMPEPGCLMAMEIAKGSMNGISGYVDYYMYKNA